MCSSILCDISFNGAAYFTTIILKQNDIKNMLFSRKATYNYECPSVCPYTKINLNKNSEEKTFSL